MTPAPAAKVKRAKCYQLGLTLSASQTLVTLTGDIDVAAAPDLGRLMASLDILTVPIHVDMSAVSFVDSSGLTPLIEATRRRTASRSPIFVGRRSRSVRRFLEIAGMASDPVLDVNGWDRLAALPPLNPASLHLAESDVKEPLVSHQTVGDQGPPTRSLANQFSAEGRLRP